MRGCAGLSLLPMLASAVLVGGCAVALRTLTLDIAYDEAAANRGYLSSLEPRRIQVAPVTDKRAVTAQIGFMINQHGVVVGHAVSGRPVPEIVRDALVAELKKNGHAVNSDEPDVVFSTDINEFRFDYPIGTVAMTLTVTDGRTGAPLLTREYRGVYRRGVPHEVVLHDIFPGLYDGFEKYKRAGQYVMNAALQRMMRDLATDQKLVEALRGASASR